MKTVRIIKNTNGAGRMQIQDGCIVQYREELTDLTIDAPVQAIGPGAFRGAQDLRRVVLPAGVQVIGQSAFEGCPNLEEVVLPDGLLEIQTAAFSGCSQLKRCNLPDSLRVLAPFAFTDTVLEEVIIPPALDMENGWSWGSRFETGRHTLKRFVWPYGPDARRSPCLLIALGDLIPERLEADRHPLFMLPAQLQRPAVCSALERKRAGITLPDGLELACQDWLKAHPEEWNNLDGWWDHIFIRFLITAGELDQEHTFALLRISALGDHPEVTLLMLEYIQEKGWTLSEDVASWYAAVPVEKWKDAAKTFSNDAWLGCPLLIMG